MPIILTLLLAEKKYIFKQKHQKLSLLFIILATLYVAAITEWLFPLLSDRFTSDPVDLLFYSLGSAFYYFFMNKIEGKEGN
jgi:predicted membrane channel-forming protein YqfA (hemolysin III family)